MIKRRRDPYKLRQLRLIVQIVLVAFTVLLVKAL